MTIDPTFATLVPPLLLMPEPQAAWLDADVFSLHGIAIAGFVIEDPSSKRVAFRGRGPSLTIPGALANPQMVVFNSAGQAIASNDDWTTLSAADRNELTAAGMAPASSLECAWIATVAPGTYTAQVAGVSHGTGIALVEINEL